MKFKIVAMLWTLFGVIYCEQSNLTQPEQIIGKKTPKDRRASLKVCGSVVAFIHKVGNTTEMIGSGAFLTVRHVVTSLNPIYKYMHILFEVVAMAGVYYDAENQIGHEYPIQRIDYNRYGIHYQENSVNLEFAIVTLGSDLQVPTHGFSITIDVDAHNYYDFAIEIGSNTLYQYEQKYWRHKPSPSSPIRIPMESKMCDFTVAGRLLVNENHLVAIAVGQNQISEGFAIDYENLTYYFNQIKDWLYRKISDPTLMTAWGPRRVPFTMKKLWGGGDEYENERPSQGSEFQ